LDEIDIIPHPSPLLKERGKNELDYIVYELSSYMLE